MEGRSAAGPQWDEAFDGARAQAATAKEIHLSLQ
jgi:hypothetical protein